MRVVPVMATKGGTGKTKVCVSLGRALKSRGLSVGFLDVDWVAPNLHIELGITRESGLVLSQGVGDTVEPIMSPEGFPLVSSAFVFPPDQAISMDEESTVNDISELIKPGVINWGPIDYLLMDTPPTTSRSVHSALKIPDLYGVVMVTQPASTSIADLFRTVSLLRDLRVPVLGLVGNQVYVVCDHGEKLDLYDLSESDIRLFCDVHNLPYLGSIPHVLPKRGLPHLDGIVDNLTSQEPVMLSEARVSSLPYKLLLALVRRKKDAR